MQRYKLNMNLMPKRIDFFSAIFSGLLRIVYGWTDSFSPLLSLSKSFFGCFSACSAWASIQILVLVLAPCEQEVFWLFWCLLSLSKHSDGCFSVCSTWAEGKTGISAPKRINYAIEEFWFDTKDCLFDISIAKRSQPSSAETPQSHRKDDFYGFVCESGKMEVE